MTCPHSDGPSDLAIRGTPDSRVHEPHRELAVKLAELGRDAQRRGRGKSFMAKISISTLVRPIFIMSRRIAFSVLCWQGVFGDFTFIHCLTVEFAL